MAKGGYLGGSTIIGFNSAAYVSPQSSGKPKPKGKKKADTWATVSGKSVNGKSPRKPKPPKPLSFESMSERDARREAKGRGAAATVVVVKRGSRVLAEGTCADRLTTPEP